ncbi:tetratricopeptide repeat protein [Clostridium sp. 19966]|uniref:tetratricopeptide repeat protein n=1 Tax=Clostridium sp. 19966 TaxID=2768166 RepID=UPI0028DFC065|nr:tetratricopeptide repeat protein [Clostridium sp. 19966]MDT8718202.1 tetratricopeptide repeat protein [Clostridium sp. 19966]
MNILTPGEKIKKIRDELKISQRELTYILKKDENNVCRKIEVITRNYISEVENNKEKLTQYTAIIIVNNINRIYKNRKINKEISVEFLLEDTRAQRNTYIKNTLENLSKCPADEIIVEDLIKSNNFIDEYSEDIENELKYNYYQFAVLYFFKSRHADLGIEFMLKCTLIAIENNYIEKLISLLADICKYLLLAEEYKELVNIDIFIKYAMKNMSLINNNDIKRIKFSIASAYKNLNKFKESLETIQYLIDKCELKKDELTDIYMLMANCYFRMKDYQEAEKYNHEALKIGEFKKGSVTQTIIYRNLSEIEYFQGRIGAAIEYLKKADINEADDIVDVVLAKYHNTLMYIRLKSTENLLKSFKFILENGFPNQIAEYELSEKVINYLISNSCNDDLEDVLKKIEFNIYTGKMKNQDLHELFFHAAWYFKDMSDKKFTKYVRTKGLIKEYIIKSSTLNENRSKMCM